MSTTAWATETYQRFADECLEAGLEVERYRGRFFYDGPAVRADNKEEFLRAIRATTVDVQWDSMGREGYIVYPTR